MDKIPLSSHAVKILKIIKHKNTSINDLARDLDKSFLDNDIGEYMIYLYKEGYIKKSMPLNEDKTLSVSEKMTLAVKGVEYLRTLKQRFWSFIRKSIMTPIFVTLVTFILCKYFEKYFW